MIIVADPSIASDNAGDAIISRYVRSCIQEVFPGVETIAVPTQLNSFSRRLDRLLSDSGLIIIGGSNLISGRFPRIHQWANLYQFLPHASRVILLGAGWHQYEKNFWPGNKLLLRSLLSNNIHAARDQYTFQKLSSLGVKAINTSCPTLWKLNGVSVKRPNQINQIIFTLTYYHRNPERDLEMIRSLKNIAKNPLISFWPQSYSDIKYFNSLSVRHLIDRIIPMGVSGFEHCLKMEGTVYVGTRLHAGIHALNLGVPAYIYGIDNRATEISKHTFLPVFNSIDHLEELISSSIEIVLPMNNILKFKSALKEVYEKNQPCL